MRLATLSISNKRAKGQPPWQGESCLKKQFSLGRGGEGTRPASVGPHLRKQTILRRIASMLLRDDAVHGLRKSFFDLHLEFKSNPFLKPIFTLCFTTGP
jgi:hypothetical protein